MGRTYLRTCVLGAVGIAALGLGGCQTMGPHPFGTSVGARPAPAAIPAAAPPARIAALLPLTGSNAALGQALLHAAQLALDVPGAPALDPRDTGGTPEGAATAARAALAGGDTLILGPLTAPETAAAASVAISAKVPVLAFTSDPTQARPGVWTLGLTPAQQVRRMVAAAQAQGKTRFAALLPEGAFGNALAAGYIDAVGAPIIHRYGGSVTNAIAGLHDLSGAAQRHPGQAAQADAPAPIPAALPFDVLLLAESGARLQQLLPALTADDLTADRVRILGPALWAADAARLFSLAGAWYAAPDPALRQNYEARYRARFGGAPPALSDLAYDAASLARVLAGGAGFGPQALAQPEGFAGVDGVIALLPDGHVKRGLALFEIGHGPAQLVQPSPATVAAPGL